MCLFQIEWLQEHFEISDTADAIDSEMVHELYSKNTFDASSKYALVDLEQFRNIVGRKFVNKLQRKIMSIK